LTNINRNKAAVGYRLNPAKFIDNKKYPERPFGVFMIIGKEF